jgi:hypothetical protein
LPAVAQLTPLSPCAFAQEMNSPCYSPAHWMNNDGRRGNGDHADRDKIRVCIGQLFQHQAVGNGTRRADREV